MELALICVSSVLAFVKWRRHIPVGIAGAKVRFQFDDPCWDGLTKTIVFQGAETKDVILDGDSCELPQEVVSRIGASVRVGVYGTDSDKNIAIPTLWAHIGVVQDATDPSGDPAADPSLPIWAQLQKEVENIKVAGGVNVSGAVPGQMIVVKKVNENGIPTEWEAVDRTHWVEDGGMTELIPETTLTPDDDGIIEIPTEVPNLVAGDTYTVNWNGVEYNCVAQEITEEGMTASVIGNIGAMTGGTDTGEPFVIMRFPDDAIAEGAPYVIIYVPDGSTSVTLSIYGNGDIVHKLDNKFLDLAWLPIVKKGKVEVATLTLTANPQDPGEYFFSAPFTITEGEEYTVVIDDVGYPAKACDYQGLGIIIVNAEANMTTMENISFLGTSSDTPNGNGTYGHFINYTLPSIVDTTIAIYTEGEIPNMLPEEWLPESVGGIVVRSSTEGSTKKFHLTIDDSGAITAAEIT